MKIYTIKITLRGVSPMVCRRLRISGDTTLATLHYIIQIANIWDDCHLHQFHIYGQNYRIPRACGMEGEDAKVFSIDDFEFDVGDRFTYEYNFYQLYLFDIRIEGISINETASITPFCIGGTGMPDATKSDEYDKKLTLLKSFIAALLKDKPTPRMLRKLSDQAEALNEVKFNRKRTNRYFRELDPLNPSFDYTISIV